MPRLLALVPRQADHHDNGGQHPSTRPARGWSAGPVEGASGLLCLMYGCLGYSGNFFLTLLPDYLRTNRGLSPDTAQWLSSLPFACGVIACFGGGAISDAIIRRTGDRTRGRHIVGAAGMALAASAILGTLWVRDPVLWASCSASHSSATIWRWHLPGPPQPTWGADSPGPLEGR